MRSSSMTWLLALLPAIGACSGPGRAAAGGAGDPGPAASPAAVGPGASPAPPVAADSRAGAAAPDPEMRALVEEQNRLRARHCAPPLAWSPEIAAAAQGWADHLAQGGCQLRHSQARYGQNLAATTAGAFSAKQIAEMWYGEIDHYDFQRGGFSGSTGHFTQLVWIGSLRVGCGAATCGGLRVWVCDYDPPGNVEGRYRANVKPASCRR